jgi:alkylated DNA repair protein (DNA oxidative demethylase)
MPMRGIQEQPEGLRYEADLLTEQEEAEVLDVLRGMDLHEVVMRGQASKRRVVHFGYGYAYESRELEEVEPWPGELEWVRERAAGLAEVEPGRFEQVLVTRYPAGAGIGWHRDAPAFGSRVAGVSLLGPCEMRFQRGKGEERRVWAVELPPRSAYVLGGPARSSWQHSIPATKAERWSITFRTVRSFARPTGRTP